jgi:hypothetical protein
MSMNLLLAITPWPVLSAIILVVVLVAVLYLARHTAHQAAAHRRDCLYHS